MPAGGGNVKLKTFKKAGELDRERRSKEEQRDDFQKALSALIAPRDDSRDIRVSFYLSPNEYTVWVSRAALIDMVNHEIPRIEHKLMEINADFAALDDNVVDMLNQKEEK